MGKQKKKNSLKWGILFTSPAILGFLIFTIGPMIASLILSFTDYRVTNDPQFVGLKNYVTFLSGEDHFFWQSMKVTFVYVLVSVPASIVYTFVIALMLNAQVRGLTVFRTVFYIPSLLPVMATSIIWSWLFNPDFGLFNMILKKLHLPVSQWIYDEKTVIPSLVMMSLWTAGNTILIFLAGLQDVPRALYEAIEVDGGGYLHKLWYITLPTMTPTIFFNLVMAVINGFQTFTQAYVMTEGGPNNASLFYSYYLWREAFQNRNMAGGCALAWILFLVILFLARLSADRRKLFRASKAHGGFTLACVPCQSWADRVFPDLEREKRMDALWDLVLGCMRCGEEDPVEAWKDYIRRTKLRKELLDGAGYERYRFLSVRTDLILEPAQGARWMGGCNEFPGERVFIPNLPTEEVFCVPHRQKVNGRVGSSLPLNYGGGLIEDFTLWLEDGRIVDYRAEKGQELLAAIIETDEGSHYLGEFALVDQRSPIAGTGRVLYTTLYDENAACHLAIGATAGPEPEGDAQGRGFNRSALHVDFMFGSDDLRVSGRKKDGTWEDIMRNGRWTGRFA